MQDFKHITRKKRFTIFDSSRPIQENKRIEPANEMRPCLPEPPARPFMTRFRYPLLFLAVVALLTPVFAILFNYGPKAAKAAISWLNTDARQPSDASESVSPASFAAADRLLGSASLQGEQLAARTEHGETLYFSIMPGLQKHVHDYMAANKVPYGVFIAIEPSTGRILAMTSYSAIDAEWGRKAFYETYPMASLFKIVTASAALENGKINPQSVIHFRGNAVSENPKYWEPGPKGRSNAMDVTCAMGKSVNPVYGKIASDIAGKNAVMQYVQKFGFNQALFPETPVRQSSTCDPADRTTLMRMGAGLEHDVRISPLHAASMMAAIANGGAMMSPRLTDRIVTPKGKVQNGQPAREIRRIVTSETAGALTRMLSSTVTTGTSRKAFHDRRGKPLMPLDIAAKTGSISGTDPKGHYSWFAAYAPAANPRIALVALVINQNKWKIKSSHVGEQALQEFFKKGGV